MWNVSEITRNGANELARSLGFNNVFGLIGSKFVFEGEGVSVKSEDGEEKIYHTVIAGTITGIRGACVGLSHRKVWMLEVSVRHTNGTIVGLCPPGESGGRWGLFVNSSTCFDYFGNVDLG